MNKEPRKYVSPQDRQDQLTKTAKDIVDAEKNVQDVKIAKLKEQRLARDETIFMPAPESKPKAKR
jgi:hypothetical protein